jgi:hypothetical protein
MTLTHFVTRTAPQALLAAARIVLSLWAELMTLAILIVSFLLSPKHLGGVALALEGAFDVSIVGAALCSRYVFKKSAAASSAAWVFYLSNRLAGLALPIYVLVYLLLPNSKAKDHGTASTGQEQDRQLRASLIALAVLDLVVTLLTFARMARWFVPLRVRVATVQDMEALLRIEESAYPIPEQRATRETIRRRLETSPGTTFVAEHVQHGIIRSLYLRNVDSAAIEGGGDMSWNALNNGGDFATPPPPPAVQDPDSLYIIGYQGLQQHKKMGTYLLYVHSLGQLVARDQRNMYGGLRLPGFAESGIADLDEYIASKQDKLLNHMLAMNALGIKLIFVRGVRDYFQDPPSRSCAALCKLVNPVHGSNLVVRKILAPWILEHVMVGMILTGKA